MGLVVVGVILVEVAAVEVAVVEEVAVAFPILEGIVLDAAAEMADPIRLPIFGAVADEVVDTAAITQMNRRIYQVLRPDPACAAYVLAAKHRGVLLSFRISGPQQYDRRPPPKILQVVLELCSDNLLLDLDFRDGVAGR
jgi:hypothetical protein